MNRSGDYTQLADQLAETRRRLQTQQHAISEATEKIAYDLRNFPTDGDFATLMPNWFRVLADALQDLDTRPLLGALDEYKKRHPAKSAANRAVPSGRLEAKKAFEARTKRIEGVDDGVEAVEIVRLLSNWGTGPYVEGLAVQRERQAFEDAAVRLIERHRDAQWSSARVPPAGKAYEFLVGTHRAWAVVALLTLCLLFGVVIGWN
jgi:hypothetical protein